MKKVFKSWLLSWFVISTAFAQIQEQNGWFRFRIPQKSRGQTTQFYDWKDETKVKTMGSPKLKAYIRQTSEGYRIRFVPFTGKEILSDGQVRMDDRHTGSDTILNRQDNEKAYGFAAEKDGLGYFSFTYTGFDVGALTLPFKLQWKNESQGLSSPNMLIDYNVGLYWGWRLGKVQYMNGIYRKYFITPAVYTGIGRARFKPDQVTEVSRMTYSLGLGLLFGVNALNFGLIMGFDNATGPDAGLWELNRGGFAALAVGVKF
ncbi:MAG: hypothetical protein MUE85_24200 [Microscillaceae bacterium]|jgi:hypothetical protein|nr:hypothetical protein [Microscillaceae bacterium]